VVSGFSLHSFVAIFDFMKLFYLVFITVFFQTNTYTQDYYKKFEKAYAYIDSLFGKKDNVNINVCPILRFIPIKLFNDVICSTDSLILDSQFYKQNLPFEQTIDTRIDSIFSNKKIYSYYILFSKPTKNILLAELREDTYSLQHLDIPYLGTSIFVFFLFNSNEEIIKVYDQKILH